MKRSHDPATKRDYLELVLLTAVLLLVIWCIFSIYRGYSAGFLEVFR